MSRAEVEGRSQSVGKCKGKCVNRSEGGSIGQTGIQQKRLSECMESLARRERRGSVPRVISRHNHILRGKGR
jgi:hypothetical protein